MKTLILGATPNSDRYAYKAALALQNKGHEIVLVGIKQGHINGVNIQNDMPDVKGVHTITLYVGPQNQTQYFDYILSLQPKRVIFNPGTENSELESLLKQNNIEPVIACTLVMLSVGNY
jgi:predicted CoA-binding protein